MMRLVEVPYSLLSAVTGLTRAARCGKPSNGGQERAVRDLECDVRNHESSIRDQERMVRIFE